MYGKYVSQFTRYIVKLIIKGLIPTATKGTTKMDNGYKINFIDLILQSRDCRNSVDLTSNFLHFLSNLFEKVFVGLIPQPPDFSALIGTKVLMFSNLFFFSLFSHRTYIFNCFLDKSQK